MMKKSVLIGIWVFIFGGGLAAYYGLTGSHFLLAGLGLLGVGIGLIMLGTNDIQTRESVEIDDAGHVTTYRGWSAILGGILWIVLGIALFVSAIAVFLGQQESLLHWILEHPGLGLIGLGLAMAAYGSHMLLGSEEERGSALSFLGSLPGRIIAFLLAIIGLLLLAAGVVDLLFPAMFQAGIATLQVVWKNLPCQMNPIYCDR
jgi:hypothetical protein